ncbi:hypothetical protein [Chamaesiphon sp. VAR_48_metabat_135_sub]|nr:hypothetical protein [Chamaesiphon sp. VAR_48_metabat_135_sub]
MSSGGSPQGMVSTLTPNFGLSKKTVAINSQYVLTLVLNTYIVIHITQVH